MIYAQEAMKQTLEYKVGILVLILVCIIVSFVGKKAYKTYLYGIGLCVLLALNIILTIPFIKDYSKGNIVVKEGFYENLIGGRKSSFSHRVGTYGVSLYTDEGEIRLTTAPGKKDVFIIGKYYVKAYYLSESKTLLHIEFLATEGQWDGSPVPIEKTQ